MEINMHFLVLSFTFIFLLPPSSATCVKRDASKFQFSTSNAPPVAASLSEASKPSAYQPVQPQAMEAPDKPVKQSSPSQPVKQSLPSQPVQVTTPASSGAAGKTTKHASPEIDKMCEKTDYGDLCVSLIPASTKADPASVLGVLIAKGKEDTNGAIALAKKQVLTQTGFAKSTIEVCQENYSDALDNFDNAMSAVAKGDTGTMNTMLSASMTNYDTCETGFAELPGMQSPFTDVDEKLTKLTSICLAIASLIK